MVHHWHCWRTVRADHRAQFDTNLLLSLLTLNGAHNAGILPAQRGGIKTAKMHSHKELFNCPEALWVLHLSLYPFNISCPGPSHAPAKCLSQGYWNMDESAQLPIYLDVSGSKQHTSLPHTFTSAHLTRPRASLLDTGGKIEEGENRQESPIRRSSEEANTHELKGGNSGCRRIIVVLKSVEMFWCIQSDEMGKKNQE